MRQSKYSNILTKNVLHILYVNQNLSTIKIGEKYGCSSRTVLDYLNKYNIPIYPKGHFREPIYTKNDTFFSTPNPLNSFVAGFIAADGCIRERVYTKKCYELSIVLSLKDLDYLNIIKNLLEYNGSGPHIRNNKCALVINSCSQYYNDLLKHFNITQNKSYTMCPPKSLSWDNKLAFLVGLIDGDGCIFRNKKGCLMLSVTGSEQTCIWVKDIWDQILVNGGFNKLSTIYQYKKKRAYSVSVCAKRAKLIANTLKTINVPKMQRKWSKI